MEGCFEGLGPLLWSYSSSLDPQGGECTCLVDVCCCPALCLGHQPPKGSPWSALSQQDVHGAHCRAVADEPMLSAQMGYCTCSPTSTATCFVYSCVLRGSSVNGDTVKETAVLALLMFRDLQSLGDAPLPPWPLSTQLHQF